jgi:hypothetical protein
MCGGQGTYDQLKVFPTHALEEEAGGLVNYLMEMYDPADVIKSRQTAEISVQAPPSPPPPPPTIEEKKARSEAEFQRYLDSSDHTQIQKDLMTQIFKSIVNSQTELIPELIHSGLEKGIELNCLESVYYRGLECSLKIYCLQDKEDPFCPEAIQARDAAHIGLEILERERIAYWYQKD